MNLLLTGGSGFLGQELLNLLLNIDAKIWVLSRKHSRLQLIEKYKNYPQVTVVAGDITSPEVIEDSEQAKELIELVDVIVHSAGHYSLDGSYSDNFLNNVVGTQNMLFFSNRCKKLKSFHYVSTIAVAGDHPGQFAENNLEC